MNAPASNTARRRLPAVDAVLRSAAAAPAIAEYGRPAVVAAVRQTLARLRMNPPAHADVDAVAAITRGDLARAAAPTLRPVFNLTGTVLHTNLGRAPIAESAIEAATTMMRSAVTLEYDVEQGRRGERDDHLRGLLCELTGAEDATVVNNNAAAVLLVLNTFALGREAIVSRGELIEIGGAFRMPEIMARAGAKLVEVGTTNRTHLKDYAAAIGPATGIILKVHPSNYHIEGFAAEVPTEKLAVLARSHRAPLFYDLGSGTLVDLAKFGLAHETTVSEALAAGADLVTFSGDKLLGGPQAGFIVGRKTLLADINRNPLKRALRVDKIRLAALVATLRLYRDPERLAARLPTLRWLTRTPATVEAAARRMMPYIAGALGADFTIEITMCRSQIGSGALPVDTLPSAAIAIRPTTKRHQGVVIEDLAAALRQLPVPVLGRIERQALLLDLRCLDDEPGFVANLAALDRPRPRGSS